MVVLERPLSEVHHELDLVTTPSGDAVAMVHCNNGASELAAWANMFTAFSAAAGAPQTPDATYAALFSAALEGEPDAGGLLAYNHLAGEPIAGLDEGRPLVVRTPDSRLTLPNFMRAQLYGVFGTLALGMDVLHGEGVQLDRMYAHGGMFRTAGVAQRFLAAALDAPVAVAETASEGGAWGMAVLAAYVADDSGRDLDQWLRETVFATAPILTADPERPTWPASRPTSTATAQASPSRPPPWHPSEHSKRNSHDPHEAHERPRRLRGLVRHRQPEPLRRRDPEAGRRAVAGRRRGPERPAGEGRLEPVLKDSDSIRRMALEINGRDDVIGVIAWMHTFSPAKMWISGLDALQKPLLHLHTQANVELELPWNDIDFDFMNLNQAAHGDREFGYIQTRLGVSRKTVVGHVSNPAVRQQIEDWERAAAGWTAARTLKLARFGDNMRFVAVTEGDKTEAELRFGVQVNTWGVNELVDAVEKASDADIDALVQEYVDSYDVVDELLPAVRATSRCATARRSSWACARSSRRAASAPSPRRSKTSAP